MIVFQVNGQSHRLSKLKGKAKDVIKILSTYCTTYTEEALGRQLSQASSKPDPVDRVWTAHYIAVHMMCSVFFVNDDENDDENDENILNYRWRD